MKEQKETPRTILIHIAQEDIPERIDLWPRLQKALVSSQSSSLPGEFKNKSSFPQKSMLRHAFVIALVLIAAVTLLLTTPQGRALAQNMFRFFNTTGDKSFALPAGQALPAPATPTPAPAFVLPLEPYQEIARPEPTQITELTCNTPDAQAGYYCKIKGIEAQAGFDVKEFLYDPKGTKFVNATYDAETQQVTLEFEVTTGGGYLYLRQGINQYTPAGDRWGTVPSDSIDQVTVNGNYAEIARGTYVVYPNATAAVWEPGGMLSLVWREGDRWYVLEKMGDPYPIEWITKDELVKLAEGLVDERPLDATPPQDPENLKSVADAEKLAGFDVLVPTLLPEGYELKRVLWVYDTVRLLFGSKDSKQSSLMIVMGPVENNHSGPCTECPPGTNQDVRIGPWQGWYWQGILFTGTSVEGQPTPTAVWQADSPNWHLVWNTDSLWIGISFNANENGLVMNRETLIAIAESMK